MFGGGGCLGKIYLWVRLAVISDPPRLSLLSQTSSAKTPTSFNQRSNTVQASFVVSFRNNFLSSFSAFIVSLRARIRHGDLQVVNNRLEFMFNFETRDWQLKGMMTRQTCERITAFYFSANGTSHLSIYGDDSLFNWIEGGEAMNTLEYPDTGSYASSILLRFRDFLTV